MSDSYIKHGFLAAVYEPWVRFEGSEWGDCMTLLWEAYDRAYIWSDEEMDILEGILRGHLDDAADSFFFEEYGTYEQEVIDAQKQYADVAAYWKGRSEERFYVDNGGPEVFAATEASIPAWMKSPDPEEVNRLELANAIAERDKLLKRLDELKQEFNL